MGNEELAFLGSNLLIASMLATGAATIFPVVLHSTIAPEYSLTAYDAASGPGSLWLAAVWWPVAFLLTASYFVLISRRYVGKVSVKQDDEDYS
jgi:cytochrome d ubiquinol oxidase subunit II